MLNFRGVNSDFFCVCVCVKKLKLLTGNTQNGRSWNGTTTPVQPANSEPIAQRVGHWLAVYNNSSDWSGFALETPSWHRFSSTHVQYSFHTIS